MMESVTWMLGVGNFREQVWGVSRERHHLAEDHAARRDLAHELDSHKPEMVLANRAIGQLIDRLADPPNTDAIEFIGRCH